MTITSNPFNPLTVLVVLSLCVALTGCGNSDSGGGTGGGRGTASRPKDPKEAMITVLKQLDTISYYGDGDVGV